VEDLDESYLLWRVQAIEYQGHLVEGTYTPHTTLVRKKKREGTGEDVISEKLTQRLDEPVSMSTLKD